MAASGEHKMARRMLYTVLCSLLLGEGVLAAELVEERLIGWRGETHHTNLCWGKRTQCYGVNVNTGRKANGYGSKDVASSFLYRYDKTGVNPTYAHMAMIEAFPNGTLMAIWQAGKDFEGTKDQHFMTSYSLDTDGADWSSPTRLDVIGGKGFALWGPVLFADAVGQKMWLFYSENTGTCKGGPMDWMPGGDIKAITYDLSTNVWAEEPMLLLPQDEDNGIPKVTANKPTELSTGEWLLPFWRERALVGKSAACEEEVQGAGSAGVLRSKDRGKTWEAHGYLTDGKTWLIENAVTEGAKGEALMVFRTQVGRIYQARSLDGGVGRSGAAGEPPQPQQQGGPHARGAGRGADPRLQQPRQAAVEGEGGGGALPRPGKAQLQALPHLPDRGRVHRPRQALEGSGLPRERGGGDAAHALPDAAAARVRHAGGVQPLPQADAAPGRPAVCGAGYQAGEGSSLREDVLRHTSLASDL